ncbi:MAG TPA: hypothetical protein PLM75_11220 [bacterium]|nr:hypothetical protein [bacterium]
MHLLTVLSKLTNYANKLFEVDCPQLGIFITANTQEEAVKKLSEELNRYFEIADLNVRKTEKHNDIITHKIKLVIAR